MAWTACPSRWAASGSAEMGRERLGIVGESGSGTSMTGRAILRPIRPPGQVEAAGLAFVGTDLAALPERGMRALRGARISLIMQDPGYPLNPVMTAGRQIAHEPTSALDVSIQAEILNLSKRLRAKHSLTCLLVSHNLPVVGILRGRMAVMSRGQVVEIAAATALHTGAFEAPGSRALFAASAETRLWRGSSG